MSHNAIWMGKPIDKMDRSELAAALGAAIGLSQSVPSASFIRSDIEVSEARPARWSAAH